MANVGAAHPENHVFGDVGGVVGDSLQGARDEQHVQRLAGAVRAHRASCAPGRRRLRPSCDRRCRPSGGRLRPPRPCRRGTTSSARCTMVLTLSAMRGMSTGSWISGSLMRSSTRCAMLTAWSPTRSRSALILSTARMKRRSIAIGCCMASRSSASSSISRSASLMACFAGQHHLAELAVAGAIGFGGAIDGLLGQPAHPQEFLLQFVQSLLKAAAHYPNLPVM